MLCALVVVYYRFRATGCLRLRVIKAMSGKKSEDIGKVVAIGALGEPIGVGRTGKSLGESVCQRWSTNIDSKCAEYNYRENGKGVRKQVHMYLLCLEGKTENTNRY
jgi:hypothetical protein